MSHLLTTAAEVLAAVPDPGQGEAPPGAEGFLKILRWAAWVGFGLCVLGVIITGSRMAVSARRGEGDGNAIFVPGLCAWRGAIDGVRVVEHLGPAIGACDAQRQSRGRQGRRGGMGRNGEWIVTAAESPLIDQRLTRYRRNLSGE